MGVVYRARDLALDRDVALKLLAPHLADDVTFRERFLTESRVAASLEHPNVVPIQRQSASASRRSAAAVAGSAVAASSTSRSKRRTSSCSTSTLRT